MWCIVNLPNNTQQAIKWDPKAIGQECLEKVCKALGIVCEMEYFGLEHWSANQEGTRTHQWINLRNRLSCDSSSGVHLMLALRVKFWVPVHYILQENVRNIFYMQARQDLLEGRLHALNWENAAKLAALLCQADGIRFNEESLKAKYTFGAKTEQMQLNPSQQSHQQQRQQKERKEKDYGLSFKKRRLSKQKSIESIDNSSHPTSIATHTHSSQTVLNNTCNAHNSAATSHIAPQLNCANSENSNTISPLRIYNDYIIHPDKDLGTPLPEDFLHQIAVEHGKLSKLQMPQKSAKYWLLREIQDLPGHGEEFFSGVSSSENSQTCDVAVGAHGITVSTGDEKNSIPFTAIAAAKSFRRTFKLEYVDDLSDRKELEMKLPKHSHAAGLYRSITERHAFYVCDKVRGVVTNQFTRDLKGTIASMFKEDTELGKRYVFDIQHTCREVHDQARRTLHERGIEITSSAARFDDISNFAPKPWQSDVINSTGKLDMVIREQEEREAEIERCVDMRILSAMTCKICMDREITTMFNPCCHVIACLQCAARCTNCPNCRANITNVVKIYLPPELRNNQSGNYKKLSPGNSEKAKINVDLNNN